MLRKPKAPMHVPAEALDRFGNPRIGGGCPAPRRMMMAAAGVGGSDGLTVKAVDFDDAADYMNWAGDVGINDTKTGWVSFWINITGGDGTNRILFSNSDGGAFHDIQLNASNKFAVRAFDVVGDTQVLAISSDTAYTVAGSGWLHVAIAWNLATPVAHLYIDGSNDEAAGSTETDDDAIDYTKGGNWGLAAQGDGGSPLACEIAEWIWMEDEFFDISNGANNLKLRTSGGKPEDVGADGSTPSGTQPSMYFSVRSGGAAVDFDDNLGSLAAWSLVSAPPLASTSPSD